jgi:hypothetical protein
MAVLSDKVIMAPSTRLSNYLGNSNTTAILTERVIEGTGVNKRPGWRKLPRIQKAAPLTYAKSWLTESHGNRAYSHTESSGATLIYDYELGPLGSIFGKNSEIPGVEDDARYRAKSKLFDQLKGEGANLANMLGERKQVAAQLTNVLNTVVYSIRDLRRGNIVSAIRRMGGDPLSAVKDSRVRARIKGLSYDANREIQRDKTIHAVARELRPLDIGNQWLALQYGWKPLFSDVYDVIEGLHKREKTLPKTFRASSKLSTSAPSDSSWAFDAYTGKNMGVRSTSAVVKYMIRAFPDIALAEPAALGFTDPATVLWEITPWSFVVDWFLPVGNYLSQLTATHGWIFYDGCESVLVKSKEAVQKSYNRTYTSLGWTYSTSDYSWGTNLYDRFGRSVLGGFPTPDIPQFKNPFSIGHIANSIALLSQLVYGKGDISHGVPRRK